MTKPPGLGGGSPKGHSYSYLPEKEFLKHRGHRNRETPGRMQDLGKSTNAHTAIFSRVHPKFANPPASRVLSARFMGRQVTLGELK